METWNTLLLNKTKTRNSIIKYFFIKMKTNEPLNSKEQCTNLNTFPPASIINIFQLNINTSDGFLNLFLHIQYYFIWVSGLQPSGLTIIYFTEWSPQYFKYLPGTIHSNYNIIGRMPEAVLFCNYPFILLNPFVFFSYPSTPYHLAAIKMFSVSMSLFLFCFLFMVCVFVFVFLGSKYKWNHLTYVFFCLTYFTYHTL